MSMFSVKKMFSSLFKTSVPAPYTPGGVVVEEVVESGEDSMESTTMVLKRRYYEKGNTGILVLPDGTIFNTIERPWLDNEPYISCVPEGTYPITLEKSDLVERLTKGKYVNAYTINDVPGRSVIRFHQANYPSQLEGCIATGNAAVFRQIHVVWSSGKDFERLMTAMEGVEITHIRIEEEVGQPYHVRGVV